jgi:hypothetical protein
MRTRRFLALTAPTAFAASTAFSQNSGADRTRKRWRSSAPTRSAGARDRAQARWRGHAESRIFLRRRSKRHRRAPLPARGACHRAGHFGPDPLARDLPRSAGEDDSRRDFHFVIAALASLAAHALPRKIHRLNKSADRKAAYGVGNRERDKSPSMAQPPPAGLTRHQGHLARLRYGWCAQAQSRHRQ